MKTEPPAYTLNARFLAFVPLLLASETEFNRDGSVKVERDPQDPGGTTKFGIDQRSHPKTDIANLTLDGAKRIYFAEWLAAPADELCQPFGELFFDTLVNGGKPALWIQTALRNTVDKRIVVDGWIGTKTCAAALAAAGDRATAVETIERFCDQREDYYRSLPKFPRFGKGWLRRNASLRAWALKNLPKTLA